VFEIGNTLREARTRQALDFPEVEVATKIRAKYLRALEDEQFEVLPSPTYVKGFLRTYAEYLGLDGQLYLDEYNSRFLVASADEDLAVRPRRERVRPRRERRVERNAIVLAILGIGVVTALIFAAWRFGGGDSGTKVPNLRQATPPAHHSATKQAHLLVRAVRGSSLVQVRLGSATGRPARQGTLEKGESWALTAKRLWLSIGTPENVSLKLDGRALRVGGAKPCLLIVTRKGPVPAGPNSC
jgi:cytoskeleton protein RodZ